MDLAEREAFQAKRAADAKTPELPFQTVKEREVGFSEQCKALNQGGLFLFILILGENSKL